MNRSLLALVAASTLAFSAAPVARANTYLTIGDPAPSLAHATWMKGEKVSEFKKGNIYVVEFWATWCEPCKENIPNLTLLAKKYAGVVSISGIDIWESTDHQDTSYKARVAAFVKKEGDKMAYNVAADDLTSDIANGWMKAAGEGGIPMSFVIGKDGKIAWIGHAQGLEQVLEQITAGTYNLEAAKQQRATEVEIIRPVKEAMDAKKYANALTLMDAKEAKQPTLARFYLYDRYTATAHLDLAKTQAMSRKLIQDANGEIGVYQMMSSVYATQKDLSQNAYKFGMSLIQEALAKKDREYLFLSMAGAVSMQLHDKAKAIEFDQQAVDAAEKDSHAPAPFVQFLKHNLEALQTSKA